MHYRNVLLTVTTACIASSVNAESADIIIQLSNQFDNTRQGTSPAFIITREDIQRSGFESINAVINALPFARITMDSVGDGTTAVIDMRGFGETAASAVRVLLNGIPLNNPTNEAPNFSFIPIASIESIEVTPGGGGVEYGPGAIGGVINIKTLSGQQAPFDGVSLRTGSYGHVASTTYGVKALSDALSMGYSASHRRKDGYRHHSDVEQSFASLDLRYALDPNRTWSFTVSGGDENRLATGAATDEALAIDRRSVGSSISILDLENTFLSSRYDVESSGGRSYSVKGYRRLSRQVARFDYGPNGSYEEASDQKTGLTGYSAQASIPLSASLSTFLTIDGEQSDYDKTSNFSGFLSTTDRTRARLGLAAKLIRAQESQQGTWKSTLGIRMDDLTDRNHQTRTELEYRGTALELSQQLSRSDDRTVVLKIARGFRFPTFDENDFTVSGSPLNTQKSTQLEITARTNTWLASVYLLDIDDEIRFVDPASFLNGSYDKTRRYGVDLQRNIPLAQFLSGQIGYQYIHAIIKEGLNSGGHIPAIPGHTLSSSLSWVPTQHWSHQLRFRYQSETYALNDPGNVLGQSNAFVTARLESTYRFNNLVFTGAINNLFDTHYDLYRIATSTLDDIRRTPAEPRGFELSFRYEF